MHLTDLSGQRIFLDVEENICCLLAFIETQTLFPLITDSSWKNTG